MNILEIGATLIQEKIGTSIDSQAIANALQNLLGGEGGEINIPDLISQFSGSGGLQSVVESWLGDGSNQAIGVEQITDIFGGDKISEFASQLGIGEQGAAETLSDVIPQLIDKVSSGGSLLEGTDLGGMFDLAKKLF